MRGLARQAEQLGYDLLFAGDHLATPSPLPVLATLAGHTSLGLGVRVACNELRHPVQLARDVMTIGCLCGKPVLLGIGAGWDSSDLSAVGALSDLRVRNLKLREAGSLLAALRGSAPVRQRGHYYNVDVREPLGGGSTPYLLSVGGGSLSVLRSGLEWADSICFAPSLRGGASLRGAGSKSAESFRELHAAISPEIDRVPRKLALELFIPVVRQTKSKDLLLEGLSRAMGLDEAEIDDSPYVLIGDKREIREKIERVVSEFDFTTLIVPEAAAAVFSEAVFS